MVSNGFLELKVPEKKCKQHTIIIVITTIIIVTAITIVRLPPLLPPLRPLEDAHLLQVLAGLLRDGGHAGREQRDAPQAQGEAMTKCRFLSLSLSLCIYIYI